MKKSDLSTPCFIVDQDKFINNISNCYKALKCIPMGGIVGYSVKTNPLPFLLKTALENGCYAEVVSSDEYKYAKMIGFPIKSIIYNGPMKDKETFLEAVHGGAIVNIENFREIAWLDELKLESDEYRLGVRVNIDFSLLGLFEEKHANSRFGFSYENGDLYRAINSIRKKGYSVNGIHAHRTSTSRALTVYEKISRYISSIVAELNLSLNYLDIGGGYFGDMPGKPDYTDYVSVINKSLLFDKSNTILVVEPGNALIASPVDYLFEILDTKYIDCKLICSSNATRLDVDPFFHKTTYCYEREEIIDDNSYEPNQCITGSTCLENDIIMELIDEHRINTGERIRIKNIGAYTMALTPNFINFLPMVYVKHGENYKIIRHKWRADLVMQENYQEV